MNLTNMGIFCTFVACGLSFEASRAQSQEIQEKYFSVWFLTIADQDLFDQYRCGTKDIVKQMGGLIEREFEVVGPPKGPMDVGTPNRVVVMSFDTPDGAARLQNHPEYLKFVPIRNQAVTEAKLFFGDNIFSSRSSSKEEDRMYLLKVSSYHAGRENRINSLDEINKQLSTYGFHTEKIIHVKKTIGLDEVGENSTDEIALHFHDRFEQNELLHQDAEVMKMIGEYNKTFVKNFVYLGLKLIDDRECR